MEKIVDDHRQLGQIKFLLWETIISVYFVWAKKICRLSPWIEQKTRRDRWQEN